MTLDAQQKSIVIFLVVEWSSRTTIFQGRAITVSCQDYITVKAERKKGEHLGRKNVAPWKSSSSRGLEYEPLREPSVAFLPLSQTSWRLHAGRFVGFKDLLRPPIHLLGTSAKWAQKRSVERFRPQRSFPLRSTRTRTSSPLLTSWTGDPARSLVTVPRSNYLLRSLILYSQPDGCSNLAHGQSFRAHSWPRFMMKHCLPRGVQLVLVICESIRLLIYAG